MDWRERWVESPGSVGPWEACTYVTVTLSAAAAAVLLI